MIQSEKIIVKGFSNVFEHMCNFMAVARTGKPSETLEGLVQLCFVLRPEVKLSTNVQFVEGIEQLFGLEIPEHQIQNTLETMIRKGSVSRPAGTNIVLDIKLRHQIEERIKKSRDLEERVKNSWLESLVQKNMELPIEKMWPVLQNYLSRAFCRHGMQTASLLDPSIDTLDEYTESLSQLLTEVIEDMFKTKEQQYVKKAISAFLAEVATDTERSEYIAQLADGAFNFYTLEVSPDLTEKLQANLNEMVLFLDTNFLFGILGLHNNSQVEISHELIRAIKTHNLPFRLRYHEATRREMINTISFYSGNLQGKKWTQDLSRAAAEATNLSGLEQKYHKQNAIQHIDVDEFLRPYQHLDVLLKERGIDIFRPLENRLQERSDLHHEYEEFLKEHGREDKVYETINHDVTVLDAVRQRRSDASSTLEAGALLVSCDYLLYKFDWQTSRRNDKMACVVLPNIFWQILRPFVPSDCDFARSFAQTFAIPEFRAIDSKGSKACSKMLSILASYKNVPEETAFKMLSNDLLLDKLKTTTDDKQFVECVKASFIEENKNLIEEKASIAKQLEKEKLDKVKKEKEYNEKIKTIELQKAEIEKAVTDANAQVEKHQQEANTAAELAKFTTQQFNDKTQESQKEGRIRQERAERYALRMSIIAAIASAGLLIFAFEFCVYYFGWQWLINHNNKLTLEIGFDLVLALLSIAIFVPKCHKMFWLSIAGAILLVILGTLGK